MRVCESALWGSVFDPNQWEWGQNGGQAQTYMPQTYSWLQGLDSTEELGGQSRFLLHLSPSGYSRRGCHIHTPTFISHWLGTVSEKIPFQVPECRKTGICWRHPFNREMGTISLGSKNVHEPNAIKVVKIECGQVENSQAKDYTDESLIKTQAVLLS